MAKPFTGRAKELDRLKKLLLRAQSSNSHEASLAKLRADEFIVQHRVTDEELAGLFAPEPSRRSGGGISRPWQEELAFRLARAHGCRALQAEGKVVFEGVEAVEASSRYKRLTNEIEIVRERFRNSQHRAFQKIWEMIFCGEMVRVLFESREGSLLATHGVSGEEILEFAKVMKGFVGPQVGTCVELCVEEANREGRKAGKQLLQNEIWLEAKTFSIAKELPMMGLRPAISAVFVMDQQPGNCAMLFHEKERLLFRNDLSSLDDSQSLYVWAFEMKEQVRDRDRFLFTTLDREIEGEVRGRKIHLLKENYARSRSRC